MNNTAPALPLRDIHLPEAISWWPPAPGWWLLLFAILVLGLVLWLLFQRWQHRQRQRDSINLLTAIRADFSQHQNTARLLRELSVFMRRSCITFYPRQVSASLTGGNWLHFLDETCGGKEFVHGVGKVLASAPYLPASAQPMIDSEALLDLCEDWLRAQPNKNYYSTASRTVSRRAQSGAST